MFVLFGVAGAVTASPLLSRLPPPPASRGGIPVEFDGKLIRHMSTQQYVLFRGAIADTRYW